MGSLASRPTVPSQPQVVYVPQPAATATTTAATTSTTVAEPSAEETNAAARRQSLLGRSRSRFGTVLTGFRGVLGTSQSANQRKTLLGE